MSISKEAIKKAIASSINDHLSKHGQPSLTSDNWTKIIGGCKSSTPIVEGLANQFGVKKLPDISQFASLDAAVDYVFKNQP